MKIQQLLFKVLIVLCPVTLAQEAGGRLQESNLKQRTWKPMKMQALMLGEENTGIAFCSRGLGTEHTLGNAASRKAFPSLPTWVVN